jgi:hypothetical protein
LASAAPEHVEEYADGEGGLVLVAVVEHVGCGVSEDALSPFLKPL